MIEQQEYGQDVVITGANFPPTENQKMIAQATQVLWFVGLAFVFVGDTIVKTLGFKEMPDLYKQAKENKMIVLGGLWFLNNWGNTQLSTGAFEIYLDDQLIFSKINSGKVPTGEMILQLLGEKGLGR